ncbi:Inorganic phosphate transporter pho84 [Orbilia oligospora]|uniref:Inorganic phosphate transporter pho84 n=1 Tax=Orbilia oligospora TaxID=2813651 RepID=A0A8H2HDE1_ORBOL|nr:Inorganic phosphate transporter pho84 [Orbilia oligospora]
MWPQDSHRKPLSPVREESISARSGSSRLRNTTGSPQRGNSFEMERARSFISNVMNVRSQFGGSEANESAPTSFMAGHRPRFTGDGNDERDQGRGPARGARLFNPEDPHTPMASPIIGDTEKAVENQRYKMYRNYVFMAASMSTAVEGYAILLPILLITLFGLDHWNPAEYLHHALEPFLGDIWTFLVFKLAIFFGIPIGSILSASLSRKYDQKKLALGFLGLMLIAHLAMVLSGWGPSINFYAILIFWRFLVGVGIGGCRSVNALTSSRITTPKWRGARLGYINANAALGYCCLLLAGISSIWLFKPHLDKVRDCTEDCNKALDRSWRLISGVLLLSTFLALIARWNSSRVAPHPNNTSQVILTFSPSFGRFAKSYRNGKYIYPLIYICAIQFFGWACFYAILLNATTILWEAGYTFGNLEGYSLSMHISRIISGIAILVGGGVGTGYITLCLLVDKWGRKRLFLLANTFLVVTLVILAGLWEKIPTFGRMILITFTLMLLVAGPIGCGYIFTAEIFPRIYRTWGFMITEIVGSLGAIVGIVCGDFALLNRSRKVPGQDWVLIFGGIRILWCCLAAFLVPAFLAGFGMVETARKEVGVVEGEVYGDWGRWDDRRRMRPEQGVAEREDGR